MASIYVKPAPGGRIRMPERNNNVMPETGAWVPNDSFYQRLLIGGDVVLVEASKPQKRKPENPEKKPAE